MMYSNKEIHEFAAICEALGIGFVKTVITWLECYWPKIRGVAYISAPFNEEIGEDELEEDLQHALQKVREMLKNMDNWDKGTTLQYLISIVYKHSMRQVKEYWRLARIDDGFPEFKKEGE